MVKKQIVESCHPVIEKEKDINKKQDMIKALTKIMYELEQFKAVPTEQALTLYEANNDAMILKCIDEIRIIRGEIEQYTTLYDLTGLIDYTAKKLIDIVGILLIPEIDKSKVRCI